jgi:hypothetical protein
MHLRYFRHDLFISSLSFALYFALLFFIDKIDFEPHLNTFVKCNFFVISISWSLFYLLLCLYFNWWKSALAKIILVFIILVIQYFCFITYLFDSDFQQNYVEDIGKNYFITSTTGRSLLYCPVSYSIVKKKFIFSKTIYLIGCNQYKILKKSEDSLVLEINQKKSIFYQGKTDTIALKL